ncbi:MAG: DUF3800 domain-containing protein [Candidatus Paceibacterota bacterium]|jgi:hypothetical protein
MIYIFLDESGDLGFGERSTRWFVIATIITTNFRPIEKAVTKIWCSMSKKYQKHGELHANFHNSSIRRRFVKAISKIENLNIAYVVVNKRNTPHNIKYEHENLYTYATYVLLEKIQSLGIITHDNQVTLCADKRSTNKILNKHFTEYITKLTEKNRDEPIKVELINSSNSKSLQAVDFVSWAIFRKYERNDHELYDLIREQICSEQILYQ